MTRRAVVTEQQVAELVVAYLEHTGADVSHRKVSRAEVVR